ncbi:MAG: HDOD domain-containing protein [Proteobacteria bacterium]|nr:HDOD domain-containing protein [Pseudomonadota bacterium]
MTQTTNEPETYGLSEDVRARIDAIDRLAAMPQLIWRILDTINDEKSTAADLQRIMESDMALASKVLSLANSAYYGLRQKVTTIQRAIVIIGYRELEFLVLGAGLADLFDLKRLPPRFDGKGLWLHSLAAAWTAREMADASFHVDPGGMMVAGLLHDLGKLILAVHMPEETAEIMKRVASGTPYFKAESQLGLRHAAVGYRLAWNWQLPRLQVEAIRDHHSPDPGGVHPEAAWLVALADDLVKRLGVGLNLAAPALDMGRALNATRLSNRAYTTIAKDAEKRLPEMVGLWLQMLENGR